MHLETDDLRFLARLSKSPDGTRIAQLLRGMIAEYDKAARKSRGEEVHRALGAAEGLDKLLADIEGAEQSLARTVNPQKRTVPVARP